MFVLVGGYDLLHVAPPVPLVIHKAEARLRIEALPYPGPVDDGPRQEPHYDGIYYDGLPKPDS